MEDYILVPITWRLTWSHGMFQGVFLGVAMWIAQNFGKKNLLNISLAKVTHLRRPLMI